MSELETRPRRRFQRLRHPIVLAAILVAIVAIAAVAVPLRVTSTPEFFARYHLLERRYVNLSNSAHEGIGCRACHETEPVRNGLALIGDFYSSFAGTGQTPRFFTFQPPRREACLSCHEDDWADDSERTELIPHPAHQRVAGETRECVKCHKWTAHFETYIDKHKTMPFSGVCVSYGCHVGTKETKQCFDCHHVLHVKGEQWLTEHPATARAIGQNACMEGCHTVAQCQQCHTTGVRPKFEGLPIEIGMKSIEQRHVREDWTKRFHGPEALKDRKRCAKCHQTEGECDECHRERPVFHGAPLTWIGRHSEQTKTLDDPRCLTCHEKSMCEDCHRQFEEME